MNLYIAHLLEVLMLGCQIYSAICGIDMSLVQTKALLPGANQLGNLVSKILY